MSMKLRSLKIAVLAVSVLAGTVQMASADNNSFPTAPRPTTSGGTGPCCTTSGSVR